VKYKYSDRAISRCRFTPTRVTTANFIDICGNVYKTWPLQAEQNHVHSRQPWHSTVVMHKVGWNVNVKPTVHPRSAFISILTIRSNSYCGAIKRCVILIPLQSNPTGAICAARRIRVRSVSPGAAAALDTPWKSIVTLLRIRRIPISEIGEPVANCIPTNYTADRAATGDDVRGIIRNGADGLL